MLRPAVLAAGLAVFCPALALAQDVMIPPAPTPIPRMELPAPANILPLPPLENRVVQPSPNMVVPAPEFKSVPNSVVTQPPVQLYSAPVYSAPVYTVPQLPVWTNPPRLPSTVPAGALHSRYPYYSYRRPWYTPGPASLNATIVW